MMAKTKRYEICVTKKDIELGRPQSCHHCATARAIKRKFKTLGFVNTNPFLDLRLRLNDSSHDYVNLNIPLKKDREKVENFIANFDTPHWRRYCRPFKFYVEKGV
jgi:hypothetical protein